MRNRDKENAVSRHSQMGSRRSVAALLIFTPGLELSVSQLVLPPKRGRTTKLTKSHSAQNKAPLHAIVSTGRIAVSQRWDWSLYFAR